MLDELDALVVREALAGRAEHDIGKIEADTKNLAVIGPEQGEKAAVARSEVEDAMSVARHLLEQDALPLCATRKVVRSL